MLATITSPRSAPRRTASDLTGSSAAGNMDRSWVSRQYLFQEDKSATAVDGSNPLLTSVDELLAIPIVSQALEQIREAARDIFREAAGEPEMFLGFDEVLGGPFLSIEVPVLGPDRAEYREMRRVFDRSVRERLSAEQLSRVIWASRLDG